MIFIYFFQTMNAFSQNSYEHGATVTLEPLCTASETQRYVVLPNIEFGDIKLIP